MKIMDSSWKDFDFDMVFWKVLKDLSPMKWNKKIFLGENELSFWGVLTPF